MLNETQTRDLLHQAGESIPVAHRSSEDLLRRAQRTRDFAQMMMAFVAVVLVLSGAAAIARLWDAGGFADTAPSGVVALPTKLEPSAKPEPSATGIKVTPNAARPGATIALTFEPGNQRGVAFSMAKWVNGAWQRQYYLVAALDQQGQPVWWSVDDNEGGWDDIGVHGRGPDFLTVPPTTTPGRYQICTANALDHVCGMFVVVGLRKDVARQVPAPTGPVPWTAEIGTAERAVVDDVPCAGGEVTVSLGRTGAWHGESTQAVVLENSSGHACALAVPPTAVLLHGGTQTVARDELSLADGVLQPLTLNPGEAAFVHVSAPASCDARGEIARTIRLTAPYLDGAVTLDGAYVPLACGSPAVSMWYDTRETPSSDPLAKLQARMLVPTTFSPGATTEYTVELTNPTTTAIDLDPCPSYSQLLSGVDTHVEDLLALNCGPVDRIAPGETVAFAMRIEIPAGAPAGWAKIGWHLAVPGGATTGNDDIAIR